MADFEPYDRHPFDSGPCRHPAFLGQSEQRAVVDAEARRWVGAAYHHRAAVQRTATERGAVDCARILIETWANAGLIERFEPGEYPPDWHLHRGEERYLAVIEQFCGRVDETEASLVERGLNFSVERGDILIWRWGRTFSHSAIVTNWPFIIHAFQPEGCVVECDVRGTPMSDKPMRVYSFWGGE